MVALETPICEFGKIAPDFSLTDCFGKTLSLEQCRGDKGTLIMFICNHCPFVQAIIEPLCKVVRELENYGIKTVAIMANEQSKYPADSTENMQLLATKLNFSFPYLVDETQAIAKAYGAICTPDFFGYNKDLQLQYRGRFNATGPKNSTCGYAMRPI